MQTLTAIVTNTPLWVWPLAAGLVALGLMRTRTGVRRPATLILPALVFPAIALAKLVAAHFEPTMLVGTLSGIVLAICIIGLMRPARHTQRLANGRRMVRGEWASLVIFSAAFLANYVNGVAGALAPELVAGPYPHFALATINGFSAGFMATRTIAHLSVNRRDLPALTTSPMEA